MLKICGDEPRETKMGVEKRFEKSKVCIIQCITYLFVNGKCVKSMKKRNILLYIIS